MHTEIDSEEDPLFPELPLNTLITWTRCCHLTAKALTLVLRKKVFGVVGSEEKEAGLTIVLLT